LVMGVVVAAISAIGDVRVTWSFSAITVLVYYALTNLAALRLDDALRRYPRWVSLAGLIGCLGLAAFVDFRVVAVAAGILGVGLVWHTVARRLTADHASSD
ncbi:MAG TPA: amino acid permease, partial [Spirochaetia bacterium]|nr:amino acid permease [Spirochaetia bacterium]